MAGDAVLAVEHYEGAMTKVMLLALGKMRRRELARRILLCGQPVKCAVAELGLRAKNGEYHVARMWREIRQSSRSWMGETTEPSE